jgi:hypothetical protein
MECGGEQRLARVSECTTVLATAKFDAESEEGPHELGEDDGECIPLRHPPILILPRLPLRKPRLAPCNFWKPCWDTSLMEC